MNNMEISLVLFTVLTQAAVGLTLMVAVRRWSATEGPDVPMIRIEWLVAALALGAGMISSLFHLGHPGGSPRTLLHISTSWLSREVLSFFIFSALVLIGLILIWTNASGRWLVTKIAALVGLLTLAVSAMAYAPPSFPALNNGVPILFYLLTAFILGSGFSSYFAPPEKQPLLTKVLLFSLILGLVVNLTMPSIWLSGGTVMQMTGQAYYGSALYWARMVVEFGLCLAVVAATGKIPVWVPVVLLAGELAGRIMFFSHVIHTAANIGGLY